MKDVKSLHDLGFAIHHLKPRSKMPIEAKWSTGPRKTWKELERSKPEGANVGVRLGKPSKVSGGYLAVVDCDVKSADPKHRAEMEARFSELFGETLGEAPSVLSGRGNGSRHVYAVTKEPARAQRLAQSSEKVRLMMPSIATFSRYEASVLTPKEIERGVRLRPAWEISLMGDGQQVVLPPSVHPDSGKPYTWEREIEGEIPGLTIRQKAKEDSGESIIRDFMPVEVDLVGSKLPSRIVDQILSGDGVNDRSSALLGVSNAMLKAGMSDVEILSVLTDPENYLGSVGYDHAQTKSRARAAEWVRKYTLEKAKRETLAEKVFDDEVEIADVFISDREAEIQAGELVEPLDWRDLIERGSEESGSRPKNTLKNVILILQGEGGPDLFRRDEFANAEVYGRLAPWGSKLGAEVTDLDTIRVKKWLAENYRFEPSDDRINQAISAVADLNRFHPVRDYLDGLEWDGVPRIDTWLREYLGAEAPEPYLSAVSRKILVAMIARIYQPGVKFDYVPILEGLQGAGKSTALRNLSGDAWFTDAQIDVKDKDAVMTMRSIWLIELGELSSMRAADVDDLKAFVSRTTDRIRVPYGKRSENFPRQCVFIGTTNRDEYLKDPTGNRRFWPVKVGACDFNRVTLNRDQLLAEAKFAYELGEPLYLENPDMVEASIREQEARSITDSWEEILLRWFEAPDSGDGVSRDRFTLLDLFSDLGPLAGWKPNQPELKRAGDTLRKLGFEKVVTKTKERRSVKVWARKKTPSGAA